jgi:hypothetical protein
MEWSGSQNSAGHRGWNQPGFDLLPHNWAVTPPQYPYFSPPHSVGPGFGAVHAPERHSTIDIIATSLMFVFAVSAGACSFSTSAFWAMGWAECETCNPPFGWAYLSTWGGIAVATVIASLGVVVAAVRGKVMWIWPTVALALIVVGYVIGFELLAHYRGD